MKKSIFLVVFMVLGLFMACNNGPAESVVDSQSTSDNELKSQFYEMIYPEGLPMPSPKTYAEMAQPKSMSFNELYLKTLELNRERFANLDLIQVGDTVLLPELSGIGVRVLIAKEKDLLGGKHDCIWRISERYLAGELITVPADTIRIVIPEKEILSEKAKRNWLITLFNWIGLLAVSFFLAAMIKAALDKRRDPDNHPAVGPDLRNKGDEVVRSYFRSLLKEGEKLLLLEKGYVQPMENDSPNKILVKMEFGDGKPRKVWMKKGESAVRIVIQGKDGRNRSELYRSACANGFTSDGMMSLPPDWEFVKNVTLVGLDLGQNSEPNASQEKVDNSQEQVIGRGISEEELAQIEKLIEENEKIMKDESLNRKFRLINERLGWLENFAEEQSGTIESVAGTNVDELITLLDIIHVASGFGKGAELKIKAGQNIAWELDFKVQPKSEKNSDKKSEKKSGKK